MGNNINFDGEDIHPDSLGQAMLNEGPSTRDLEKLIGLKPVKEDQIESILRILSEQDVRDLRQQIDDRFDFALICFSLMTH